MVDAAALALSVAGALQVMGSGRLDGNIFEHSDWLRAGRKMYIQCMLEASKTHLRGAFSGLRSQASGRKMHPRCILGRLTASGGWDAT